MQTTTILYPLFAMIALTYIIGIRSVLMRYRAVLQDGLSPRYFLYNNGGKPPEYMLRTEQHYDNLFQLPVLFYAVVLLAYTTAIVDLSNVLLAWLFVIIRMGHAYIHIRTNQLQLRRNSFMLGALVLLILWTKLFIQLIV